MPSAGKGSKIVSVGVSESKVSELISNYGIWTIEDSFTDTNQQNAVEDVISPISFGVDKTSPNGLVRWNAALKVFVILKGGPFIFKTRVRAARVGGSTGESELFFQAQLSVDLGSNWFSTGNSVDLKLDDNKQVEIFFDSSPVEFSKDLLVRQMFARSSLGTNFGSLISGTPSTALISQGVAVSPAAQVTIYRLKDFNYV